MPSFTTRIPRPTNHHNLLRQRICGTVAVCVAMLVLSCLSSATVKVVAARRTTTSLAAFLSQRNVNNFNALGISTTSTPLNKFAARSSTLQHAAPPSQQQQQQQQETSPGVNGNSGSRSIMTDATTTAGSAPTTFVGDEEMSFDDKYLFDLNGYIVVRGVLSPEEVDAANAAIDSHSSGFIQRSDDALRNAKPSTKMYGTGPGRKDLGGVLEWPLEEKKVFQSILAHPKLLPYFHTLLGKGYRMDHLPFVLAQDLGGEGFALHGGTIDCESGDYNPHLAYTYMHGTQRCSLLGCNVMLTDHNPGDGGFCIVPGSHKSNFKMPQGMVDGLSHSEFIQQVATKAGDVVLFSEGTVHGALPWTVEDRQRRACLYRFAPATISYGRSYMGHPSDDNIGWPTKMYDGLTDAQKSVLEPPYANRLDRPNIQKDATTVELTTRSARKRQHDQDVFGTKYF